MWKTWLEEKIDYVIEIDKNQYEKAVNSNSKILLFLYYVPAFLGLLHELGHYVPAKIFDLNPRIDPSWSRIRVKRGTDTQRLIIILTPFVFLLLSTWLALKFVILNPYIEHFKIIIIGILIGYYLGSLSDLYTAGHFLVYQKWHDRKYE
jgi:hypothetical protein